MLAFAALIVVNAGLQAIVAQLDQPTPSLGLGIVSALVLVTVAWIAWRIADPARGLTWRDLGAVALAAVATAVAAVAFPYVVPVVVAVACALLAAPGVAPAGRMVARAPWRSILLGLLTIVVVVLLWAGSALSGLLVGGWVSSVLVWLVIGAVGAGLVSAWVALSARLRAPTGSR